MGIITLVANDGTIGVESCEELFTPNAMNIGAGLDGVDILVVRSCLSLCQP